MSFVFLALIFLLILACLAFRRPLYQAMLAGIAATVICFGIPLASWPKLVLTVVTKWSDFSILVSLYLITYLQKILEEKEQLRRAEQALDGIFHNRRVNAMVAPLFIGLLPSAAAMVLCADLIKSATKGYLKKEEQAFVTSWVRHVPEAFLPTYPAVLLMANLSGNQIGSFMLGMLPVLAFLLALPYFSFIRRLPRKTSRESGTNPWKELVKLLQSLWSLLLLLFLIVFCHLEVVPASLITILLCLLVYRIPWRRGIQLLKPAFEVNLLGNMFLVLVFKAFLDHTEILQQLPTLLQRLPIPAYLIFVLLFFLGGIVSGVSGIIALGTPLAFAALPDGGPALMVLLMTAGHAASQLSPTHVCLSIASDCYHISFITLLRKTLPYSLASISFALVYYLLWTQFF